MHRVSELSDEDLQRLYRYARSLTRNGVDAYDLVHTAIVRWLTPGRPVVDQPRRYLMVAVRNLYFDERRGKRVEERVPREQNDPVVDLELASLEDVIIRQEQVERIWRLLSDVEREMLFLWAVEGFTVSEISTHTGVPRGTLLARIHRLRRRILAHERFGDRAALP